MTLNKKTNLKNKSLYMLILPALMASSAAYADDFQITRGTFFMSDGVTSAPVEILPGTPGTLTEGIFQGSIAAPALLADFIFFGQPVSTYTAQTGVDNLTHPTPNIDLVNLTADMSSFYAYWNGNEFNQGYNDAAVVDNFDGSYTLTWSSQIIGGPFNLKIGTWTLDADCLTCPPTTPGAKATLSVSQGGIPTDGRILTTGGNFTVATNIADTTGYIFNWSTTDDAIDGGAVISTSSLSNIDPSTIPTGQYAINAGIKNGNTTPIEASLTSIIITIVDTGAVADFTDTDNDGISDDVDGIDNLTSPTLLQLQNDNAASYILESSAGRLSMGRTAVCSASNSATVTLSDIKNNGDIACAAVPTATDINNVVQSGIGGYFNFSVTGLTQGDTASVVIPLATALPKNAGIRKHIAATGWNAFTSSSTETAVSVAGTAGDCPAPGASWDSTLAQGDNCVRLTITDGGKNDADGLANGAIEFTGTVVGYEGIGDDLVEGCSLSKQPKSLNQHSEWLLLAAFIAGLGFMSRRNKRAN